MQRRWSATIVAETTGEGTALVSVRLVDVGSASRCVGVHDKWGRCSGLCSLGRRGLKTTLCWQAQELREMLRPLLARSTWALNGTVVAGMICEGGTLKFDRLFGVVSASNCRGGQEG